MTGGHLKDFQGSFQETVMSEKSKRPRRSFSAELKQDAVDLVVKQGYSFKAAADAVGVSVKSLTECTTQCFSGISMQSISSLGHLER